MALLDRAEDKLKEIGFKPEQIDQVKSLVGMDLLERIVADASEVASEAQTTEIEATMTALPSGDLTKLQEAISKVAEIAYGGDATTKIDTMLSEELMNIHDDTLALREKYKKLMAGDPDTVAEFKGYENDPKVQEEMAQMKAAGIDIEKAITEANQQ
jgi:hypothetical protein